MFLYMTVVATFRLSSLKIHLTVDLYCLIPITALLNLLLLLLLRIIEGNGRKAVKFARILQKINTFFIG